MYKIFALLRASALSNASYRVNTVISLGWLLLSVVPLYFVSGALQPIMSDAIRAEGGEYFAFLLVGMITISFLTNAITSLPSAIGSSISNGLLEALIGTSTRLPVVFAGMIGYGFVWTAIRAVVLVCAGVVFGAHFAWERSFSAVLILILIVLAYLPVGIVAASLILAFRTQGPLAKLVMSASALLGGVYYPTHVIPSWIENISAFIPLTYGLRALRRTVLEGLPFGAVASDLLILSGFVLVLMAGSTVAFSLALRYARRSGTLSHY